MNAWFTVECLRWRDVVEGLGPFCTRNCIINPMETSDDCRR